MGLLKKKAKENDSLVIYYHWLSLNPGWLSQVDGKTNGGTQVE